MDYFKDEKTRILESVGLSVEDHANVPTDAIVKKIMGGIQKKITNM